MHIYVRKLTTIGQDNGLSPGPCQSIILTDALILIIRPLGTNISEIVIGMQTFSFKGNAFENVDEMASFLSRPQCVKADAFTTPISR